MTQCLIIAATQHFTSTNTGDTLDPADRTVNIWNFQFFTWKYLYSLWQKVASKSSGFAGFLLIFLCSINSYCALSVVEHMYICTLQHNTCPICRKTLGTPADEVEDRNEQEATDATDSNSTDSSDNDVDTDSSNEEMDDSAATASSPVADGGHDCIADESTESAASIPDRTPWNVQPDGSMGIPVNITRQSDPRNRSSSSSSSEYSSL